MDNECKRCGWNLQECTYSDAEKDCSRYIARIAELQAQLEIHKEYAAAAADTICDQATRIAELNKQLKNESETWQSVINTQYVPRIQQLDGQLKTAKRDAILKAGLKFPSMLRKMWSGTAVVVWLEDYANSLTGEDHGG